VTPIDGLAKPDVVAPGRRVVSLRSPGSTLDRELPDRLVIGLDPLAPAYFRLSGTSMAAPIVTGVVALMLERSPALTPEQVKNRLKGTATALPFGSPETTGSGLVDAPAAVAATDQTADAATDQISAGFASEMYPFLFGQPLTWRDLTLNGGVDSNDVAWSEVSWLNVAWDAVTWQNVNWEAFNWSAVNWQEVSWENISWEGISWELVPLKDKGRKGYRAGKVLD